MASLTKYLQEKLQVNKDYKKPATVTPADIRELSKIVKERLIAENGGTEKNPVDLNDIDVSKIENFNSFFHYINQYDHKIVAIDISDWNMSNAEDLSAMFLDCKFLKTVGDLSNWDMSNIKDIHSMFSGCHKLKKIGNIGKWKVDNVLNFNFLFKNCEKLEPINIDSWKINSSVTKDRVKMVISGTTGWKQPAWIRQLK